jgi:hypothetical protein
MGAPALFALNECPRMKPVLAIAGVASNNC